MDRFVLRRGRQRAGDTPLSSSAHSEGGRPQTSAEGRAEASQSQSQRKTGRQATTSQSQSQTLRVGVPAEASQNQTQTLSSGESADEDSESQSQNPSVLVNREQEHECRESMHQSAHHPEKRQKCERPSQPDGRGVHLRTFQAHWSEKFPWLEYELSQGAAFCHVCKSAFQQNCLTFAPQISMTFIETGFRNWKKAMERFRTHERSECHRESLQKTKALSAGVTVHSAMSNAQRAAKVENREALLKILSSLRFLVTQGLAIRGHIEEKSNFYNLLRLRCEDCPVLRRWMQRTSFKWCSHEVSNEMLELMSHHVARSLVSRIVAARHYAVMVDETADTSIQEQLSICFRIVTEDLEVEELFLGFHSTTNTKSETIFNILMDILCRFNLPIRDCRGQCFDGARNMAGVIRGVQARVRAEEPRALFVHCMAHTLSLTVHDLVKLIPGCRNVLNLAQEMIAFIRESPKRHHMFQSIDTGDGDAATPRKNLRPFCPTRWTVRCHSLSSILSNFTELMDVMEELAESERSQAGYKAHGFFRIMKTFDFFFHLSLLCKVFGYVDTTNSALQKTELHFQEAAAMISTLSSLLSEFGSGFDTFWERITATTDSLSLARPKLPRRRQAPCRFRDVEGTGASPARSPKDSYREAFSEVVGQIRECISSRFQTEAAGLMAKAEQFLTGAETDFPQELREHFQGDVDEGRLRVHRDMLLDVARSMNHTLDSMAAIVQFLQRNHQSLIMFTEVRSFLRLLLTVPVSTSTAERSFSTLRRLKTYLRSRVTQKRLNHMALLDVHGELAKDADLHVLADEFVSRTEIRRATFALRTSEPEVGSTPTN